MDTKLSNTQASLTDCHLDLLPLFFKRQIHIASADNLARIEGFINTYILFDKIIVSHSFHSNDIIQELNLNENIFIFDSDINNAFDDAYIDLSLHFKNSSHLKNKANLWAEQYITSNATLLERQKLINSQKKNDLFYYYLLAQFKSLQILSLKNDAISILSPALMRVYPINTKEIKEFISFAGKEYQNKSINYSEKSSYGNGIFDIPELKSKLKIKLPNFFEEFLLNMLHHIDATIVLSNLRKKHEPLRYKFRQLIFELKKAEVTINFEFDLHHLESEWNAFIENNKSNCELKNITLLKQGIIMLDVVENLRTASSFSDVLKHCKIFDYHYKLTPSIFFDKIISNKKLTAALNIREIISYDYNKLFNKHKKYLNLEKTKTSRLASTVLSSITSAAQLKQTDFDSELLVDFCQKNPPHLYMICTRPKISINPIIQTNDNWLELCFEFNCNGNIEREYMVVPRHQTTHIEKINYPNTELTFLDKDGHKITWHTSILFQKILKDEILNKNKNTILTSEMRKNNSTIDLSLFSRTDLKVEYIGQAFGTKGNRTALDRLKHHDRLQHLYSYVLNNNPSLEVWIILLPLDKQTALQTLAPNSIDNIGEVKEFMHRSQNPIGIDIKSRINFTEAALINYFSPQFNGPSYKKHFPSTNHISYQNCYSLPIDFIITSIETQDSLGCRLYSAKVKPKFFHVYNNQFNSFVDKEAFFGYL